MPKVPHMSCIRCHSVYFSISVPSSMDLKVWAVKTFLGNSPGLFMSTRHEWGSITRPFLSTTDSAADKQEALLFQTLTPPLYARNTNTMRTSTNRNKRFIAKLFFPPTTYCCVVVFRVAAVDDDIPSLKERNLKNNKCSTKPIVTRKDSIFHEWLEQCSELTTNQFVDEVVHSLSCLDQQDDSPGLLQLGHHVLQRLGSNHFGALRLVLQEVVHLGHGSVVSTDLLGEVWWLLGEIKKGLIKKQVEQVLLPEVMGVNTEVVIILPQSHGHSCSWWGFGPWQPNQSAQCLLCEETITNVNHINWASTRSYATVHNHTKNI